MKIIKRYLPSILTILTLLIVSVHVNGEVTTTGKVWGKADYVQCVDDSEGNPRYSIGECPEGLALPPEQGPTVAFTDLISGPDTGLGDGLGSGAIVTVWGYNLGSTQGSSTIEFVDSLSVARTPYVYYWKNADGQLPSGPANLYESHGMQEIAFSIPDSALGTGRIKITVDGKVAVKHDTTIENPQGDISFTVRSGNIYHVAANGSNANDCSYANPCAYINANIDSGAAGTTNGVGNARMSAGDIVYSHGVQEPTFTVSDGRSSGMFLRGLSGTLENQIGIVAYPNNTNFSRVTSAGYGIQPYLTSGIVASKFLIKVGHADPTDPPNAGNTALSDTHVGATTNGRAIANLMQQNEGTCFTGWGGAIVSGSNGGDNFKAFGNHIDSLGCDNSSRFAHTAYMAIRNEATTGITPWEFAYNYLSDNNLLYGIHFYDEQYTGDCGDMTGTLKVHNNVIVNQRGAGINIGTNDASGTQNLCWTADIEITNNLLINVGLGVPAEDNVVNSQAIQVGGDLGGDNLTISNNTVYGHGESTSLGVNADSLLVVNYILHDPVVVITNNSFIQTSNVPWLISGETISGSNNSFWSAATNSANNPPSWTNNIITDPLLSVTGSQIVIGTGSPLIDAGGVAPFSYDIYGKARGTSVGAVQ